MQYTADNILVKPQACADGPDLILSITPEQAGWDYISFQVRELAQGKSWSFASGQNELALVNLSGRYTVDSDKGRWSGIGTRNNVFAGAAHALYLPRGTEFTVTADPTDTAHPVQRWQIVSVKNAVQPRQRTPERPEEPRPRRQLAAQVFACASRQRPPNISF